MAKRKTVSQLLSKVKFRDGQYTGQKYTSTKGKVRRK